MHFFVVLYACKSVDRGISRFIQNVLRSTLLHVNKTTKNLQNFWFPNDNL